jgi:hypothetical protein
LFLTYAPEKITQKLLFVTYRKNSCGWWLGRGVGCWDFIYLQQFEIKRGTKMVNFKDVKKRK